MEKRIALLVVGLIVICLSSSIVVALPPMGPPKALLGQNQWDVGLEYSNQKIDLQSWSTNVETRIVDGVPISSPDSSYAKYEIKDLKSNMILGRVDYGINGNWDVFLRLGVADAQDDISEVLADGSSGYQYSGFDGGYGFAWGLGTRTTFWQDGDVTWGGLFQITWSAPDDSSIDLKGLEFRGGNAEIDFREIQVAAGPTVQMDNFQIYGGPFLHFVNGDLDISGTQVTDEDTPFDILMKSSGDIWEESQFGGYAGAYWDVRENIACYIEGQFTGDAWSIGVGATRRF